MKAEIEILIESILTSRNAVVADYALLVGISGIDASGKGFITRKIEEELVGRGFKVANINLDGWLNLPHVRFSKENPGEHFYKNAIRFEEMFEKLILPLKEKRSIKLTADLAEETAHEFHKHEYIYKGIDIILLEGIFLFKKEFVNHFDLRIWVECTFEKALERAIARSQEGLPPEETVNAYKTIFSPAQMVHFERDSPQNVADQIFYNS